MTDQQNQPSQLDQQRAILLRLHLAAGPLLDDDWTSDERAQLRSLADARLIEHHFGVATITPEGAAIAERALSATAAWDAVRKHLLHILPRPGGCTIVHDGTSRPAPDWLIWSHASSRHDSVAEHSDPMQAVLLAAAALEAPSQVCTDAEAEFAGGLNG